jgi:POT family proton-dependent oligopeptide transporter
MKMPADATSTSALAADASRFPPQVRYILGNEACERFSFYGMKSILAIYALSLLGNADQSTVLFHWFAFLSYLMPLWGGWISDKHWGRYNTILRLSLLYCAGHGILALSDLSAFGNYKLECLYAGLLLIAVGAGGIKPCVSAFMGDQFGEGQTRLVQRAYAAFYWSINIGSLCAPLLIPWVRDRWGYGWAFAIPGVLMGVATFVFWLGRHRYRHVPAQRQPSYWQIIFHGLFRGVFRRGDRFLDPARRHYGAACVNDAVAVNRILWVFLLVPPFFALFEQHSSTWVLQGRQMEALVLWSGLTIGAEQMQSANPAFVILLVPVLTLWVYPRFRTRLGAPLRRMAAGMCVAAFAYLPVAWLQYRIENGETPGILWQLIPYFIITLGEVLVSATGLEFAYTQAPKSMKGTVTSLWLLTIALGQLLIVAVTHFGGKLAATGAGTAVSSGRFLLYAGLMSVTAVIFAIATARYPYSNRAHEH